MKQFERVSRAFSCSKIEEVYFPQVKHIPVLLSTVLDLLDPKAGETVIDVTVGLGGHAKGFLERIGPKGKLIGLDADAENLRNATIEMRSAKNVRLIHANFRDVSSLDLPL